MAVREPRVQAMLGGWIVWGRRPFGRRTGDVTAERAKTGGADQHEQRCLRLVAVGQVTQPLLDQRPAREPRGVHARSIAPGPYFAPIAGLISMVATVLSHCMVMVMPASLTLMNPMVNCSTDEGLVTTLMGARSTSNLGS